MQKLGLAVTLAVLLSGCVPKTLTQADFFQPGRGLVVIGVAVYGEAHQDIHTIEYRKASDTQEPATEGAMFEDMTRKPLTYQRMDFDNGDGMMGAVYLQSLPAGNYEITTLKLTMYDGRQFRGFSPKSFTPIRFSVRDGQVVYLGTYTAVPIFHQRGLDKFFGLQSLSGALFAIENREAEDIAIAEKKMGTKITAPVMNAAPDPAHLGDPKIVGTLEPIPRREVDLTKPWQLGKPSQN